jgi:fructose-1,6-bisphosphatase/sedoheptulose 1,7-bisphosphatase-like protein
MATTDENAAPAAARLASMTHDAILQACTWPTSQKQVDMCRERGINRVSRKLATDDLAQGNVILAAAGVTSGSPLKGVTHFHQGAPTNAVTCARCDVVPFVDAIHLFSRDIHKTRS